MVVKDLYFKYRDSKLDTINEVSFNVAKGEILGFLGPSGAGKSTLQKILTGILHDFRGNVNVLGIDVKTRNSDFYEAIGVDFEFPNFYGKFTAIENLRYFASLYKHKTQDPMILMRRLGLETYANKKVASFSKGMKMRLSFIRALLHNPKLLFLDEPTSGLDPNNARIIKDLILEQKALGKTIILTTHNMHDAEELCDRVAFIVDGQIKALDTPHAFRMSSNDIQVHYTYKAEGRELKNVSRLAKLREDTVFTEMLNSGCLCSIHSQEQTLEDVFIKLTGRCLK